jgi:hypothetical protein
MGTGSPYVLGLVIWLLPAMYIGFTKQEVQNRSGWVLLAVLTSPVALALLLVVQAFQRRS